MARNVDIFKTDAKGQYIYQQYQKLEWLKKYAKFIDNYIKTNYFDKLKSMWETMDVGESLDPYLTFYTKWYFGLFRPLASASMSEFYDIGRLYDNDMIYDDAQEADGLVSGEDYLKYIKFIYDYTQETWHIDHIVAFVADYCNIYPTLIYVDYSNKNMIKIKIPSSTVMGADFIKLMINYYDAMCLPFPNVIDFVQMNETEDFWRGIIYTPYTDFKGLKEWYSPLDKYKAKNNKYAEQQSVTEDRTYQCIKDDKSVSLNDLTPQNIDNTAYWKFMQYNVNEFIMVLEDSKTPLDPNYTRPNELAEGEADPAFVPLYSKGIYKCIVADLDIKVAKVKTFSAQPTKLSDLAEGENGTPLCFGKYVDVTLTDATLQRVNIALQKWQRVADLPTV